MSYREASSIREWIVRSHYFAGSGIVLNCYYQSVALSFEVSGNGGWWCLIGKQTASVNGLFR